MTVDAMLADELIESLTTVGEWFEKNSEGIFYFVTFQPVTIKTSVILYENKEKIFCFDRIVVSTEYLE